MEIQMMQKFILLVSTCLLPTANCRNCASEPNGVHRFGSKCGFMCHCKNNEECDVISGECPSGCASMWYGPGCQYRDMAEGEFSRHSDNMKPHYWSNLANDGNLSTCSYTAELNSTEKKTSPFWRVWLPTQETIRELMIVTKDEALENFTNFSVYVEKVSEFQKESDSFVPSDRQKCYKHDNVAPENETMIVLCKTPVTGNQVRIELTALRTQLVLCDVRINGGRNLAFGRETSQSSTDSPCRKDNPDGCAASKAVDGVNSSPNWQECSYTLGEQNSWWKLDIGHQSHIWYARISPFGGVYLPQLHLDVSNSTNGTWKTVKDKTSDKLQVNNSLNTVARYVKLSHPEHPWMIRICEIQVFGDCQEGLCGYDCTKECHCRKTNIWDKISGTCSSVCKGGCIFSGKRKIWVPKYEYKCGHCLNAAPCDESTGECPLGCQEGYIPPKCNMVCKLGTYGENCSGTCSDQCYGGYYACDIKEGTCAEGCNPGWIGEKCYTVCPNGYYGSRCNKTCSMNCLGGFSNCDKVYGSCISGCLPGWQGRQCLEVCPSGYWGKTCVNVCGHCYVSTCRATDGVCESDCAEGYKQTPHCDKECENGTYGINCTNACGEKCMDMCNKRTGSCSQCTSGWHGDQCTIPCDLGSWGENCRRKCYTCLNKACDRVTGACLGHCKAGFKQTQFCDQECSDGWYGVNCTYKCSRNCKNELHCRKTDGSCLECKLGWHGKLCENETSTVIQVLAGTLVAAVLLFTAGSIITACMCKRKNESAFKNVGSKSVADTTLSFTNVQEPPDVAAAEIMESTYETIRGSSENEHEYEVSKNQSS